MTDTKRYIYHDGEKDKDRIIAEFKKPLRSKYEMDKLLEKIISPYIESKNLNILDACCGIGQISSYLSDISPDSKFLGIDQTSYLIEEAKTLWSDKKNITFQVSDIYDLSSSFQKKFDIAICWKTLSWLPYYDEMVKKLVSLTKNHIFLSALFYDGDIDFEIKVKEFKTETSKNRFNYYYNVYSLPRFKEFVQSCGIKNMEVYNFEIDTDIPRGSIDHMSTFTENLANGKKLQISGNIIQSWKIIRLDL